MASGVGEADLLPLYDPQTSGGVLMAAPKANVWDLFVFLKGRSVLAAVVGGVLDGEGVRVTA